MLVLLPGFPDTIFAISFLYYPTVQYYEGVVVPEGERERTQGYQLRLETAPVLLHRFLIIGVELRHTRGDRKVEGGEGEGGEGVRARGMG